MSQEFDGWAQLVPVDRDQLVVMANRRASELGLTLSPNDERNVINMLRHDYTDYDWRVQSSKTDKLYGRVLDAIARDFPWLAQQCEQDKATHFERLSPWVQYRRWAHHAAVATQRAAHAAIEGLSVGDKVIIDWRGQQREAEVTDVRRTRVRGCFRAARGQYACH
jgi:hypothetical protein